jgi:hypothetical protein
MRRREVKELWSYRSSGGGSGRNASFSNGPRKFRAEPQSTC